MDWNTSLAAQLGQATDMVRSGRLAEATQAIQQALAGSTGAATAPFSGAPGRPAATPAAASTGRAPKAAWRRAGAHAGVQDAVVIEPGARSAPASPASAAPGGAAGSACGRGRSADARPQDPLQEQALQTVRATLQALSGLPVLPVLPGLPGLDAGTPLGEALQQRALRQPAASPAGAPRAAEQPGSFDHVALEHGGAGHSYRLYVPPGAASGAPLPLVLMLHGCTQNPDDFATGTHMNQAAAGAGALVLYPAQQRHSNPNACWNWFSPENQQRGSGELALLVDMVHDAMARHPVDPQRIYVAGLSAGGAMAALLAREYPELFAAVGVHSGLQAGAAHSMMGALSAMKSGAKGVAEAAPAARPGDLPALIVFHGDADTTVSPRNGEQLVQEAVQQLGQGAVRSEVQQGQSPAGQAYTRTLFHAPRATSAGDANDVRIEQWTLHGAGHAWSGGTASGSHTDPRGVSATQEMLRFFLQHPKASAPAAAAAAAAQPR